MSKVRSWLRRFDHAIERRLVCPNCKFGLSYRKWAKPSRRCPRCNVPLGVSFFYRGILTIAGLLAMGWVMYRGYISFGPEWIFTGLPFCVILAGLVQFAILRAFPPKLEAYGESHIWLKLR